MSLEKLTPVYQHPSDLVLGIARYDLSSHLTVIKQAKWQVGAWNFTFQIIGESHAVRIEKSGQHLFTEVLACLELPPESCSYRQAFHDLTPGGYEFENYEVSVEFEASADLPPSDTAQMIEVAFPQIYGQTPVTRITWQQTDNEIAWQTWHVYPAQNHGIRVKSSSKIKELKSGFSD